jgi:diphosphomevalonate decarboxylase
VKTPSTATAIAHPNIAFIKYWGNHDEVLRLPLNGSISMNLDGLETRTQVSWNGTEKDTVIINGNSIPHDMKTYSRVTTFLDLVRGISNLSARATVTSENNFPDGVGIASSASAFAALALAATSAAGMEIDPISLSRLARRGSGSACRSVPGGFVEWFPGGSDIESYAVSIAPPEHWDLVDCIIIISQQHKLTGSTEGHALAKTSPLQTSRVSDCPRRLSICREAIQNRDFSSFANIVEEDSNLMHAVMMTSHPALFYWDPVTLAVMKTIHQARLNGLAACYTIDAGPNVHIICENSTSKEVLDLAGKIPGIREARVTKVGGPARVLENFPNSDNEK